VTEQGGGSTFVYAVGELVRTKFQGERVEGRVVKQALSKDGSAKYRVQLPNADKAVWLRQEGLLPAHKTAGVPNEAPKMPIRGKGNVETSRKSDHLSAKAAGALVVDGPQEKPDGAAQDPVAGNVATSKYNVGDDILGRNASGKLRVGSVLSIFFRDSTAQYRVAFRGGDAPETINEDDIKTKVKAQE
jgi:hypothetical protein